MKKIKSLTGRFGLFGSVLTFFAVTFGISSCRPDFDLDKRFPEWLGTSIYETLSEGFDGHTFNYYVRLIDALDQKSILAKTGSRTLFVADDVAFQRFLDKCPLAGNKPVRFEDLSKAQLKMILKGSMLNNVYQVASLSSTSTEGGVILGDCMRKVSLMEEYDTVRVIMPDEMPKSSFWDYLRNNPNRQTKGALVLEDGTLKPLIFFAPEFLESRKITDDDYNFLFNLGEYSGNTKPGRLPKDASVNGVRIAIQNKKCFNGFIHVMEDVVYLLPSMAEYLAQVDADGNSISKIYSSIIERFSAPFFANNNQAYDGHTGAFFVEKINDLLRNGYYGKEGAIIADALHASGKDSVFTKLYFSERFQGTGADGKLVENPKGKAFPKTSLLKFDPGWNSYFVSSSDGEAVSIQENMAAMFVPTDAALMDWWINNEQGKEMRGRYGILKSDPSLWNADSVALDMSEIDLDVIAKLVNNNMFNSFTSTVPSKFKDMQNDAQDQFFTEPSTAVNLFDKVAMCCNGAIFFSNKVFVPTAYKSVSYPALVRSRLKVMNEAIWDTEMQFFYYLNSMASAYCLFLPEYNFADENETPLRDKLVWVDPASFALNKLGNKEPDYESDSTLIALAFYYDDNAKALRADYYNYDVATNSVTGAKLNNSTPITNQTFLHNRLEDFLNYHIVLIKDKNYYAMEGLITPDSKGYAYFRTKGGGVVRFNNHDFNAEENNYGVLEVAGGWQIETNQSVGCVNRFDMRTVDGNGITYIIDKPLQTSRKSVYDILSDTENYPEFKEFFKLMDGAKLFKKEYGTSKSQIGSLKCVSTFNTYNYTVYVPDNKSIEDLLKNNVIYDPVRLDKWESDFDTIWANLQYKYIESPADCDAAWRDSVIDFYQRIYGKDIMTTDDSVLLKYPLYTSGGFDRYDAPLKFFKAMFIEPKRDKVLNFLKYHIQDNSLYTNAEFNRGFGKYSTAYYNDNKQFAKLDVTVGDDITITDAKGNNRKVVKEKDGKPYCNIMCREYVFKKYNSTYSEADDSDITDITTTKLETSSYAVIHLIDGALCNDQF